MRNKTRRLLSLLLAVLLFCGSAATAWADDPVQSVDAAAMQLMRTEGSVSVTNSSGRSLGARDDMRLYNGYHVATQASSYAWINLDDAKLTKLDQVSEAELRKSGKNLELMVNSGSLFFNVTSPLDNDETLNIRTSTMVVGIRGTSGWVRVADRWSTQVFVLDGSVQCSVADPVTGQVKTATIQSGQMASAVVYPQDQLGDKCDILLADFQIDDIDGFALVEIAADPVLRQKILADSGLDILASLAPDLEAPSEAVLEAAQQRLQQDQQSMRDTLDHIADQLAQQDSNVSTDHVWNRDQNDSGSSASDTPLSPQTPAQSDQESSSSVSSSSADDLNSSSSNAGDNSSSSSSSGSSGSSSGSNSSSGGSSSNNNNNNNTNSTETLTMPVTDIQIQAAFQKSGVDKVVVKPQAGKGEYQQLKVENVANLVVPSGKTLTIEDSGNDKVVVTVEGDYRLTVDGTMTGNDLVVNGMVEVTSTESLHMKQISNNGTFSNSGLVSTTDKFINTGYLTNTGTIKGRIEMTAGSNRNSEFEMRGGSITVPSGEAAVTITNGTFALSGGIVDSGIALYDGGRLLMSGGKLLGGDKPALVLIPGSVFEITNGEISSSSALGTITASSDGSAKSILFNGGTVTNDNKESGPALFYDSRNDDFDYVVSLSKTIFRAHIYQVIRIGFNGDWMSPTLSNHGYALFEEDMGDGYEYHLGPNGYTPGGGSTDTPGGGEEPGEEEEPVDGNAILEQLTGIPTGEAIKLTGNAEATLTDNLTVRFGDANRPITLDLNGHTLSVTAEAPAGVTGIEFCVSGGRLKIIDTSDAQNGRLEMNTPIYVTNGGYLYLEGGTLDTGTDYAASIPDYHPVVDIGSNCFFYMSGGTLTGHGELPALRVQDAVFDMSGGSLELKTFIQARSLFDLDGGTVESRSVDGGANAVIVDYSSIYVYSGSINCTVSLENFASLLMYDGEIISSGTDYPIMTAANANISLEGGEITNTTANYVMYCTDSTLPELYIKDINDVTIRAKQRELFATYSGGDLLPTEYPNYTSTDSPDSNGYFYLIEQ